MIRQPIDQAQSGILKKIDNFLRNFSKKILVLPLVVVLTACASDEEDTYIARDVETLYGIGYNALLKRQWGLAAGAFDEVERQHPYSVWSRRAQLMGTYANYMANEYDNAILSAERFLALHPGNENASYAHYMIAISYYEQISDVYRDQRMTRQAADALTEVMRRYPGTDYARDARIKRDLVLDQLAAQDMDIGRYYLSDQQYLAAIGRFRNVVDNYGTTTHVAEALHRLVECYTALGILPEARKYAAVLGYNHPGSKWYQYSYAMLTGEDVLPAEEERSFFARLIGVFGG